VRRVAHGSWQLAQLLARLRFTVVLAGVRADDELEGFIARIAKGIRGRCERNDVTAWRADKVEGHLYWLGLLRFVN